MTKSLVREAFTDAYRFAMEHHSACSSDDWALISEELDNYDRVLTRRLILGFLEALYQEQEGELNAKTA